MIFSGVRETGILLGFAVLTALALILFGAAASRVPLSTIGFIQYLSPTIQFLIGYFVFGEPMTAVRWIGFGLVWASLVILSTDALGRRRSDVPIIEQS
jgi:chloramphenicol-sensitive protein RarD